MENETDEQFEERVLNKRAAQVFNSVKTKLLPLDKLLFTEVTIRHNRKQVGRFVSKKMCYLKITEFNLVSGCTKVLQLVGTEKVPGFRIAARWCIWRDNCYKGGKIREPYVVRYHWA